MYNIKKDIKAAKNIIVANTMFTDSWLKFSGMPFFIVCMIKHKQVERWQIKKKRNIFKTII